MLHAMNDEEIAALRVEAEQSEDGGMVVNQSDIQQMLALRDMLGRKKDPEQD